MNKVLHLVLKRKYFERIYEGTKKTEYRDFSKYWQKRIEGKHYTHIKFQLGYTKNPPSIPYEIGNIVWINDNGWKLGIF